MDPRLLAILLPTGVVGLLLAPTLVPPPDVPLSQAAEATGPVRVDGVVETVRRGPGGTHVLLRGDARIWLTVQGDVDVDPGDRIRVTARPRGGGLQADPGSLRVLASDGVTLLRHVARDPWSHEGGVTVNATVGSTYKTVLYLRDAGHRLRTVPGRAPWPPDVETGQRIEAAGRLRYVAERVGYVLHLDAAHHG